LEGSIVHVTDGDTATLLDGQNVRYKLRLAGIDAPEMHMPSGQQAKQYLARLVLGKEVVVLVTKQDKYGRYIATVFLGVSDVNLQMLQAGLAWHYTKYAREQTEDDAARYLKAEKEARAQSTGLWGEANPVAPWDWRSERKHAQHDDKRRLNNPGQSPSNWAPSTFDARSSKVRSGPWPAWLTSAM
jgi:endonuclease YncB( thermonuclease family)